VSHSSTDVIPEPRTPKPGRRWRGLVFLVFSLVLVVWFAPQFWLWRAECQISALDWDGALQSLKWSTWGLKTQGRTDFLRARMHRKMGDLEAMATALHAANRAGFPPVRLEREVWLAEAQRGNLGPIEPHLPGLLVAGQDLPELCEAYALGCIQNYRLAEAVEILNLWSADFPTDPQPHYLLGRIQEHSTNYRGATQEYETALRLAPRHAPAAFNLARVFVEELRYAEAAAAYRRATPLLYHPEPGVVGQARCLRMDSQLPEAQAALQTLAQPPVDEVRRKIAYRLIGEPEEIASASRLVEQGQIEFALGNHAAAIPYFREALQKNPLDVGVRNAYGTSLRLTGRLQEATAEIAKVGEIQTALSSCDPLLSRVRTHPEDVDARIEIGKVFLKYLSEKQGLVWLNSVFAYDPDNAVAHTLLAEFYEAHSREHPESAELGQKHRDAIRNR